MTWASGCGSVECHTMVREVRLSAVMSCRRQAASKPGMIGISLPAAAAASCGWEGRATAASACSGCALQRASAEAAQRRKNFRREQLDFIVIVEDILSRKIVPLL